MDRIDREGGRESNLYTDFLRTWPAEPIDFMRMAGDTFKVAYIKVNFKVGADQSKSIRP